MNTNIRIIFTDLDGTLLNADREVSQINLQCLDTLKRTGITRVITTGRSLYSVSRVFPADIPADYLVFSTGAGIIDVKTERLLYSSDLEEKEIQQIAKYLHRLQIDFMVHHAVPENHYFTYSGLPEKNGDFKRRIELYHPFAEKFSTFEDLPERAAQIIAILPNDIELFNKIENGLSGLHITRTTSPLDGQSMWMEISPLSASKGTSAAWLCNHLSIDPGLTLGIGNDYNDISLLQFTKYSYLVANAPADMHDLYMLTRSNNDDGFYHAVRQAIPF
jgi:Cof subfamily protein (haloacid dehalogenase superfamily)